MRVFGFEVSCPVWSLLTYLVCDFYYFDYPKGEEVIWMLEKANVRFSVSLYPKNVRKHKMVGRVSASNRHFPSTPQLLQTARHSGRRQRGYSRRPLQYCGTLSNHSNRYGLWNSTLTQGSAVISRRIGTCMFIAFTLPILLEDTHGSWKINIMCNV